MTDEARIELTAVDAPPSPETEGTWLHVSGLSTRMGRHIRVYVRASWVHDAWYQRNRLVLSDVLVSGAVHSEDLRTVPLGTIERMLRANPALVTGGEGAASSTDDEPPPTPLSRPQPNETPEQFGHRVAAAYRYYAARTGKPAVAIAEASGVPVATVRRWVAEARASGALEPGSRGRAG